jgi:peptide/nickel transport system substrate-binding protein
MFASDQRGGALDYANYHSASLDAAFARTQSAANDAELRRAWRDVQSTLATELPAAWLYHSRGVQGVSARMHGVVMDLRGELATVTQWTTEAPQMRALANR